VLIEFEKIQIETNITTPTANVVLTEFEFMADSPFVTAAVPMGDGIVPE
jgi:hypothetical protein